VKQANQKEEWEKALNNYSSHLPQKVKSRIHHTRATMIDGKLKAGMEIRDALNATVAKYESLHSNVDNSIGEQTNALAAVITNLTVELVDIQAKNPGRDITASIFVASEGHGPLVLHEGSE
jgi:ABC-type molybdate transport system ATPase subunit